jgi:nitrite reductase/ring-hydroxylating ferredoxin subunit
MAAKQGKVFMTIMKKASGVIIRLTALACLVIITLLTNCQPDLSDDPIPIDNFSPLTFNVNLPEYQDLRTKGFKELNDIGVRGVIVYRVNATTYHTYERNCSYQPNEACATVNVHTSNLYMTDPCCNSTFDFATGNPTGGPAWRALRQYDTSFSGNEITITDIIIN